MPLKGQKISEWKKLKSKVPRVPRLLYVIATDVKREYVIAVTVLKLFYATLSSKRDLRKKC